MNINQQPTLEYDVAHLASGMKMDPVSVCEHFRDGRNASNMMRHAFFNSFNKVHEPVLLPQQEKWDVIARSSGSQEELRYLVLCLTRHGVSFAPSWMKGMGRSFDADSFVEKARAVTEYAIYDVIRFPEVPNWTITGPSVAAAYVKGEITIRASLTRLNFRKLTR